MVWEGEIAVVGISSSPTCGVRDHAGLLAGALSAEGFTCRTHWLVRQERSLAGSRAEIERWTGALHRQLADPPPRAILWHYSVFSHAYRGLPLFVAPTLAALRRSDAPLITVMHEFVFPWRVGGWRGKLWAVTQRAALIAVMRASTAAVLTTDAGAAWIAARPWLARRPLAVAPVFSNLPAPASGPNPDRAGPRLGLFGYSDESAMAVVLDALRLLADRGAPVQLELLGSPGRSSRLAADWLAAAAARGVVDRVHCSGVLAAQALSDALAGCDVLLFADPPGPTSRKGTLAGSLASGRPVVALDGPRRWAELVRAEAALLVAPCAPALADGVQALLADPPRAAALGARGREFAVQTNGVGRSAEVVRSMLEELAGRPSATGGAPRSR
jgi:glycosyltransferase involved in cell wall biosynthesis